MLTKNKLKYIRSLQLKKARDTEHAFVAEGPKMVEELLRGMPCRMLLGTPDYLHALAAQGGRLPVPPDTEVIEISERELQQASALKAPQKVLAVFGKPMPETNTRTLAGIAAHSLALALDDIQDPGNLGTIIRMADWFGIEHIFCSPHTADAYSPKTVQATMGAIGRVRLHYLPLPGFLQSLPEDVPVFGTFLDGQNIYNEPLTRHGILVMGNEGNGISPQVACHVNRRLFIPSYPQERPTSESLNVAVATAIACAEFRRREQAATR